MSPKNNESKPGVTHNTPDKQTPSWRSKTAKKLAAAGLAVAATLSLTACELPGAKNPNPPATAEAVPGGEEAQAGSEGSVKEQSSGDIEAGRDDINRITKDFALDVMNQIMQNNGAKIESSDGFIYKSERMAAGYHGGEATVRFGVTTDDGSVAAVEINFVGPKKNRSVNDMAGLIGYIKDETTVPIIFTFGVENGAAATIFMGKGKGEITYSGTAYAGEVDSETAAEEIKGILGYFPVKPGQNS